MNTRNCRSITELETTYYIEHVKVQKVNFRRLQDSEGEFSAFEARKFLIRGTDMNL